MKTSRIVAGGGTLLLHVLALAAALLLGPSPSVITPPRPVEVSLIRPPEPPAQAEPPRRPEPLPMRPAPPPPAAAPRPRAETAPRPASRSEPPSPAAPVVAARAVDEAARPTAITAAAAQAAAPAAAQISDGVAAAPPVPPTRPAPAAAPPAATRTGPRFDASWSGNTPPPYPSMARRLGEEGEVRLDVRVGSDGAVIDVRLKKSSGSQLLDQTAIDTVKKWRFRPATVDGQPVAEWYFDWKWVFKLES